MIKKYNREDGVPKNHFKLMKVICFGDFGNYYKDEIVATCENESELMEYCRDKKIPLNAPGGWNEYFIRAPKELLNNV